MNQFRLVGFYLMFIKFGCLRWIRKGNEIQNTFVNGRFHRCFDLLTFALKVCKYMCIRGIEI